MFGFYWIYFVYYVPVDYLITIRCRKRSLINPSLASVNHVDQLPVWYGCDINLSSGGGEFVELEGVEEGVDNINLLLRYIFIIIEFVENNPQSCSKYTILSSVK